MRTFLLIILAIIISTSASSYIVLNSKTSISASNTQPAFERLVKDNVLRCGYAVATPWFMIDPKTGEKTGVSYDFTEKVAEKMGVKVEWVEETGWGVAEAGLQANRYDVVCGNVCIDPSRNKAALFSKPFVHIPLVAMVRNSDNRFDSGLNSINDPSVKIGVKNGHVFEFTAKERFPKATLVYANDISDDTEFLEMLVARKIDIAFTGQSTADLYEKNNPGKIHSLNEAVRYCNGAFMVPLGEYNLQDMLNNAIDELGTSGVMEGIITKYMPLDKKYIALPDEPFKD